MSGAAMQELNEQFDSLTICQSNCTRCIGEEKELDIAYLNKYQKLAYYDICILLEQGCKSIITIDAPSGTGKTLLLCTLVVNCQQLPVKFIVFRKDQASEISLKNIQTYTFVSFCMHHFNLPYQQAIQMFQKFNEDKVRELYKLIVYSKKFVAEDTSVLILDMYTISSPAMLLLLYILSLKHKLHLIFAGDAMQLSSINKSVFHKESNYYIIQILKDLTISNLKENMRICDTVLKKKVANFYKLLQQVQPAGNVPLNYKLRYHLYTLFRPKYFTEERFDTIYIAQTHCNITRYLYRFIEHLRSTGTTYYEAPFCCGPDSTKFQVDSSTDKFFPTLLLVRGYKYVYITEVGLHHIVLLEDIILRENNEIVSLKIRFLKNKNRVETIRRVKLNYYQILPDYRRWLYKHNVIYNKHNIWQFPLRPYTLTYHATLGRTIDEAQVELSAECVYANFLYIGLCSVRHDSDIHKIHDERNLAGYLMTEYMETLSKKNSEKYYYRCQLDKQEIYECIVNNKDSEDLDNIEWTTINDIRKFEKSRKRFIRIERSAYEKCSKKVDTPFMQITKFVKENPNVILNTFNMVPVDDCDNYCNKKKQPKDGKDKKSNALCYLLDQYDKWEKENNLQE